MPSLGLLILALSLLHAGALRAQQGDADRPAKIVVRVVADYLALHVSGSAPADASAWEYRLLLRDDSDTNITWTSFPQPPAPDGTFQFDIPLHDRPWVKLEARGMLKGEVITTEIVPKRPSYMLLTDERIGALPETERRDWQRYMKTSERHADRERAVLARECRSLGLPASNAAPTSRREFQMGSSVASDWYATVDAVTLADAVLTYQTPTGGWSKGIDYAAGPRAPGTHWTNNAQNPWHYCGTLDNRSTTEQIKFLAHVFSASKRDDAKLATLRGVEWLLTAQYPNGGWPQNYPVERGYHEAVTLNDGAMLHAMELLLSASKGEEPFSFLEEATRKRAAAAFDQAVACLLRCQVKMDGKATVWCAQHDPLTLAPVAARLKEPPSLSGGESAEMLKFLMRQAPATPEIISAIEAAVGWLSAHAVTGLRKTKNAEGETDYISDAASAEVYWARFYDLQTGLPIFAGAQDGKVYSTYSEMAQHNTVAYDYFVTKPADVLGKELNLWRERIAK